jgi:DNA repair protein RadA/Sms
MKSNGAVATRFQRILNVDQFLQEQGVLALGEDMAWFSSLMGGSVPCGTRILIAGDPGAGKSTLGLQLAASAYASGDRPLIVTTEQAGAVVRQKLTRIAGHFPDQIRDRLILDLPIIDDLNDLTSLPSLLAKKVFRSGGEHTGASFLVLDSLQGSGVSSLDRKYWSTLYDVLRTCNGAGITTLSIAHATKSHQVAGPKSLEHAVDVVMYLRQGISARALTIPKNRNGASRLAPISLGFDQEALRLTPSHLGTSVTSMVQAISPAGIIPIEVAISLQRHDRGFVKAPGLSIKEIETLCDTLQRCCPSCRQLSSLGVTVRAPAGTAHQREYNLAIARGILAAVSRKPNSGNQVLVGDVRLDGTIADPEEWLISCLEGYCVKDSLPPEIIMVGGQLVTELCRAKTLNCLSLQRIQDLDEIKGGVA